ncbi:MAG: hypothetical protein HFJ37_05670 [Clostridia bacterium]|nr:hypothetical protein [Clostridia bacterium]
MRTLSAGNKKVFTIFAAIIVLIIGVLVVALSCVLTIDKEDYTIQANSIVFDKENNAMEVKENGTIYQKWDQNYYLKMGKEEYALGKQAIVYLPNRNKVYVYGNTFEVQPKGEITKITKETEIGDLKRDRFFKLEDRKYLVVGAEIKNQTESIRTKNYLMIQLDKSGNTLLSNQEVNMKTIKPMIITTSTYQFDVANEKLYFGEEEIDLKKIIGSSNEYKEVEKQINDTEEEKKDIQQIEGNEPIQNNQNNKENQNSGNNPNGANGSYPSHNKQDQINAGGNGQAGGIQVGNGQNQNQNQNQSQNKTPLSKSINLRGITPRSSSLDIQYAILDPENKYQTIILDIQGDIQKTIALDKTQRNYIVTGLTPNSEYKVTLAYKEILTNNTVVDGIEDTMIVRTSKVSDSITITKMAQNRLYFTYKMDKNYVYESAKIGFYLDGAKQGEMDIDIQAAVSSQGWSTSIEYSYGNEMILKLENVRYEGKEIKRDLQAKLKMY